MLHRKLWRDYFENMLVAIILALFVRSFIWTGYRVPTSSMAPTLLPGDFIFAYRLPYGIRFPLTQTKWMVSTPRRGEVVVFTFPEQPNVNYVKRVIGLPGDRVEIIRGQLSVNGKILEYKLYDSNELKKNGKISSLSISEDFELVDEVASEGTRLILRQKSAHAKSFGPLVIPPHEIFLMGDNRDVSDDSRYWGTVPLERVEGKVQMIWLSLDWSKKWADNRLPEVRRERLFTGIQ